MKLLYGHSETVTQFVIDVAGNDIPGAERGFGKSVSIGVIDNDGLLVAGIVYHNWEPEAGIVEISVASITRRWLTRPVLRAMFSYPFDQIGCQMIVMRTDSEKPHIGRMMKAVGAREYIIERLGGRNSDVAILTLTAEAWKASGFAV